MGEARRKRDNQQSRVTDIEAQFVRLGIDYSRPGFYDDPAFLAHERTNPRFLEQYAQWVLSRRRSAKEDARTRDVLPRLADIIVARLQRHEWAGGCFAVAGMVARMLDRIGIWNCTFKGSATISNFASEESRYFAIVDENQATGYETGHMWLAVPPFDVVDMTLRYQHWEQDPIQEAIEPVVLAENAEIVAARAEDVVAPAIRRAQVLRTGRPDPGLHLKMMSDQARFGRLFPARRIVRGDCEYRYVPSGISATDVPLERINIDGRQGAPAIEIWRDDVIPGLGLSPDLG